jgi:metallophosphoesterase (TIGR03768 family)
VDVLRRDFLKYCVGSATALGLEISPFANLQKALAATPTYPISTTVLATLDRTIIPVGTPQGLIPQPPYATIFPSDIALYDANGYGFWDYGGPFPYSGIDIQTGLVTSPSIPDPHALQLVSFFTMSDVHIVDKESPAQCIYYGYQYPYPTLPPSPTPVDPPGPISNAPVGNSSCYSGIILYTTHVLDAAVQTVNALHKMKPFNFGICLGDDADNTQYNEHRWFIDVMDGKWIQPSSGAHLGAGSIDYQTPYQAAGLDKSIPWYAAVGNHDQFWKGSALVNSYIRNAYVGSGVLKLGSITSLPPDWNTVFNGRDDYMGVVDGSKADGTIKYAGLVSGFSITPKVAADPNRRSLPINYWMSEFFNTTSQPIGHGFTQQGVIDGLACYSFNPVPGIPLKVIVLDDTDKTGSAAGSLDTQRYNWLIGQLQAGQAADELMIICAHIPVYPYGYQYPTDPTPIWTPKSCISDMALIQKINSKYQNVIMWISGHVHRNTITPHPAKPGASSNDPLYGHGLWMVETPSLRDFPQQFRRFEIVRNSDNMTLSILVYSVDPAATTVSDGLTPSPALKSRTNAVAAQQVFGNPWQQGPGMDPYPSSSVLNAQLVIQMDQLTTGLQKKLAKL